eukprot:6264407-Lingulodinium_polyedra.AAC.1
MAPQTRLVDAQGPRAQRSPLRRHALSAVAGPRGLRAGADDLPQGQLGRSLPGPEERVRDLWRELHEARRGAISVLDLGEVVHLRQHLRLQAGEERPRGPHLLGCLRPVLPDTQALEHVLDELR